MSWQLAGRPLASVLVTRLRYLGDIVMATSVLRALRRGDPSLKLGFLCEAGHADLLTGHPDLDYLHRLGVRRRGADARVRGAAPIAAAAHGTVGMIRELRTVHYDLAVDLFFNPRSAWLLRLAGIPQRIGGTRRWRRRLYTHTVLADETLVAAPGLAQLAPGGLGHHLSRLAPLRHVESGRPFLDWLAASVVATDLAPRLPRPESGRAVAQANMRAAGLDPERPYLVLAPGATWASKEWPRQAWADLMRRLPQVLDHQLAVLIPPRDERGWAGLAGDLSDGQGAVLPALPLTAALALVADAAGLVTVDGGIMHAGVALGVPTVALFGPTDPSLWFPYTHLGPYRVLHTAPTCHPCDRHDCDAFICLPDLHPTRVLAEIETVLAPGATTTGAAP